MGDDHRRRQGEATPAFVEIVRVLIVAHQHGVDRPQRVGGYRGTRRFGQVGVWAGRVERGVDDEPRPGYVKDGGRPTQHGHCKISPYRIHCSHARANRRSPTDYSGLIRLQPARTSD